MRKSPLLLLLFMLLGGLLGGILGEILGTASGALPATPYGVGRVAAARVVSRALSQAGTDVKALNAIYSGENGDTRRDAWEAKVLGAAGCAAPAVSLARRFGQTSALGPLKIVAAAQDGPALVHGLARGGSEVALVIGR